MEHSEAVRTQAVENYLLGNLKGEERERFEEHFFECSICAEDVTQAVVLADNAAAELGSLRSSDRTALVRETGRKQWFSWFGLEWNAPALAMSAAAFAVVAGLWSWDHAHLRRELDQTTAPQAAPGAIIADVRGASSASVTRSGNFLVVAFYPDPQSQSALLDVTISGNGMPPKTLSAPAPPAGRPCYILLPASVYKPGVYELEVRQAGNPQAALQSFTFDVK